MMKKYVWMLAVILTICRASASISSSAVLTLSEGKK